MVLDADVVVVGAGMSGLYALKRLRDEGFRVLVLEKGTGVGGTWYWNRYPGARCDIPSLEYSFGFDADLEQEWVWTEHFASQPEIERYLNHLADRYDLRRDIRLSTGVTAATFDEDTDTWVFDTETGEQFRARFAVMATGGLSAPNRPSWPGIDDFEGTIVQTSLWPEEGRGARGQAHRHRGDRFVGRAGDPRAREDRPSTSPCSSAPLRSRGRRGTSRSPTTQQAAIKARYRELRGGAVRVVQRYRGHHRRGDLRLPERRAADPREHPRGARSARSREHGFSACRVWTDTATDLDANEMAVELFREMVRRTVHDPDVAEALSPRGYPLGCKRPVLDSNYFETFNRDNVTLVDLGTDPIEEVTATGVRTEQALRGARRARARHRVRRHDRRAARASTCVVGMVRSLRDDWADGPRTYLGIGTAGYPNLFICVGPGSPGVLATYPPQIELQLGWIADFLGYLVEHGYTRAEADLDAQDEWCDHVNAVAQGTMFTADSCNSWYNGANIEGKPRVFLPYVGGLPKYMDRCNEVAAQGYDGFVLG